MKIIDRLTQTSSGSAEAVSKAILFVMVISIVTGVTTAGLEVVDNVYTEETRDQNIDTLTEYQSNVIELSSEQGYGFPNTATKTQQIDTYRSDLLLVNATSATNIDVGSDITINSRPLTFSGSEYKITYDAGIIGQRTLQRKSIVSHPIKDQYPNQNQHILPLITTTYDTKTMFSGKTSAKTILIERSYAPETETISSGTEINVNSNNPYLWEGLFEDHSTIDVNGVSGNTINAEFTEDTKIYHYQVEIKQTGV